jgi:hypothetical protein
MTPTPRRKNSLVSLRNVAALTLGLLVGVCFHYMIYRLSLPTKPFIYVAF